MIYSLVLVLDECNQTVQHDIKSLLHLLFRDVTSLDVHVLTANF